MLLHLIETHNTGIQKLILRGNTISRNVLMDIQEILHERNQYNRSDDEETSSSGSDSSIESDEDQLQPKTIKTGTKDDDVRSSTTALNQFPIDNDNTDAAPKDIGEASEFTAEVLQITQINGKSNSGELNSDENQSADEQTKDVPSEKSRLKSTDGYFDRDHMVYSNLYIQAQQREKKDPPSYKYAVKSLGDARYLHVMRVSKDGYG